MRVGILTHPQSVNYGGILQCYALCTYLHKMGHEPIVIRREADKANILWEWTRSCLKAIHFPRYYTPNKVDRAKYIRPFIESQLVRTSPIRSQSQMRKVCQEYGIDVVIVGSDQVWRKDYAMQFGYNYFLDFVPEGKRRLSYAASFGLSAWLYNEQETQTIRELLSTYSGISVREEEAVSLLKNNVNVDAIQHIDPTLLLTEKEYSNITAKRLLDEAYIFVYWLGAKELVLDKIKSLQEHGKKVVTLFLRDEEEQISVEDWLSYIKYSDSVITDSFHGCVFSIIFERQFEVLKNESGGYGRILSLCDTLGIKNGSTIDYIQVNDKLKRLQGSAMDYLSVNLK